MTYRAGQWRTHSVHIVLQAVSGNTSAVVCCVDGVTYLPAPRSDEPFCVTGLAPYEIPH